MSFRERAGRHPAIDGVWERAPGAPARVLVPADGCVDLLVRERPGHEPVVVVLPPTVRAEVATIARGERAWGVRTALGRGGALAVRAELATLRAVAAIERGDGVVGVEGVVADLLDDRGPPPAVVVEIVALARNERGAARIVGRRVAGRSARTLERACRAWLGYGPKTLLAIERGRGALPRIVAGEPLADVAADLGYADQPHMTREISRLFGRTPGALRRVGNLQDATALVR